MPSRDELIRQLVDQWMAKAQADLNAARVLVGHEGKLWAIVAFHCQQTCANEGEQHCHLVPALVNVANVDDDGVEAVELAQFRLHRGCRPAPWPVQHAKNI